MSLLYNTLKDWEASGEYRIEIPVVDGELPKTFEGRRDAMEVLRGRLKACMQKLRRETGRSVHVTTSAKDDLAGLVVFRKKETPNPLVLLLDKLEILGGLAINKRLAEALGVEATDVIRGKKLSPAEIPGQDALWQGLPPLIDRYISELSAIRSVAQAVLPPEATPKASASTLTAAKRGRGRPAKKCDCDPVCLVKQD